MPAPKPLPAGICTWCGADSKYCNKNDAFHDLLRRHDLHPWCWSGVGPGWLLLVERLVADLKAMGWRGDVAQIKEKFFELRFYAEDTTPDMEARISAATAESRLTCETCGKPGRVRPIRYWQRLACDDCAAAELEATHKPFKS